MLRAIPFLAVLAVCTPALQAQPSVMLGAGLTTPTGDLAESASAGYHALAAVQLGIPTIPVSLRLSGDYHRLGEADATFDPTSVLGGALSVVFTLPAVGLSPYFLGGVGRYRVASGSAGQSATAFGDGLQVGFGIALGALAFGAFVEIRYVSVDVSGGGARYVPFTVGLRL